MPWRLRKGRKYFYLTRRVGGRPRVVYVGRGPAAQAIARREADRIQQRREVRQLCIAEQMRLAAAEAPLKDVCVIADLVAVATLLVRGFHSHRGCWRRRLHINGGVETMRVPATGKQCDAAKSKGPTKKTAERAGEHGVPDEVKDALRELVARAEAGDDKALSELRVILDEHSGIWQLAGDLGRIAEEAWLALLTDGTLRRESIRRHIEQLRADLAGPHPSAVERLLVDRAVCCFLALHHAELCASKPGAVAPEQVAVRTRLCDSAQKRYLAAIRTLTHLRAKVPLGLVPAAPLRLHEAPTSRRRPA